MVWSGPLLFWRAIPAPMSSRTILVYPGQRGAPVRLVDVLRESHDQYRANVLAEIEKRRKGGVPLDDSTRWSEVQTAMTEFNGAVGRSDTEAVAAVSRRVLGLVDGNALVDPGAFSPPEALADITVTMQVVSDATSLDWKARRIAAILDRANAGADIIAQRAAQARVEAVYDDVVAAVVVHIDGVDGLREKDGVQDIKASIPGLRGAQILGWLYSAAQHFLDLPPKKALRCGQPAPST